MVECNEDRSVYNGHVEVAVIIDRPVHVVWAQYLDLEFMDHHSSN